MPLESKLIGTEGHQSSSESLDARALRADFPILAREIHGRPMVYLDNAATSQRPLAVLEAVDSFYRHSNANVHRGIYTLSGEATDLYEDARLAVSQFIGATSPAEIVFTRGTTEAINLVAYTWGSQNLGPGDAVLLTEMEHHSNIVPWQLRAARHGFEVRYIRLTDDGRLDMRDLDRLLDERVKLVSFVHVSNALGTVNPVAELVLAARSVGAKVLLDAAQSVPHQPVDVKQLGVDFMAFSGHKMCGPTGIGALWARREILEEMPPFHGGGEMIRTVSLEGSTFADVPAKFEAGTPAIAQAIGLAAATRYLRAVGMERIHRHESTLVKYALQLLSEVPGLTIYGPKAERSSSVTFTMDGIHPHDLASILDSQGVAVRAGHHCTMPIHTRFGLSATARASVYLYNTLEDIDALAQGLIFAREVFGLS
jgi:cysteine desulfurase/selenocysteine lyase